MSTSRRSRTRPLGRGTFRVRGGRTYVIDKQGRIRYSHSGVLLTWALRDALETLARPVREATFGRHWCQSLAPGCTGMEAWR